MVEFAEGEGTASFEMPAEAITVTCVATLKTYAVTAEGATSDKSEASHGETVIVTATLPDGALASDYDFAWSSAPAVEFTADGAIATFTMPSEAVNVSCVATLKTYAVATTGATSDKSEAVRGEKVTVTAVLPEGDEPQFWEAEWSSVPEVEFTAVDDLTAIFTMPEGDISVSCKLVEKFLEDTAMLRVLRLAPGWNLVVLSLKPDEESVARLEKFPAMTLDVDNGCYVQAREFTADSLYWLYASEAGRLVVMGEAAVMPLPPGGDDWQPYGCFPVATLEGSELWQWLEGIFHRVNPPQAEPGKGYFIRKAE